MPPSESIEDISKDELVRIFRHILSEEGSLRNPKSILIGGWAVYSYNRYHGSVDIDVLAPKRVQDDLIRHLKRFGYEYRKLEDDGDRHLFKIFVPGRVIVDFINPNVKYHFHGRPDALKLSFLYERFQLAQMESISVPVPERTALLITKIKAAWDRKARLDSYKSPDPEFERGKIIKDYSDILALIDREKGGNELDLEYLSSMLERHPFLWSVLDLCGRSEPAAVKYGKTLEDTQKMMNLLKGLL